VAAFDAPRVDALTAVARIRQRHDGCQIDD
jgi:hypothetical protein